MEVARKACGMMHNSLMAKAVKMMRVNARPGEI